MDIRDDFWDLSELIPKKKKKTDARFASDIRTAEITDGNSTKSALSQENRLTVSAFRGEAAEEEYSPAENPLLASVSIMRQPVGYSFYSQFRKNAIAYLEVRGETAEYVPFFSYIPQYSQLTAEQRAYYFYFRDALNRGEIPRADYSYFWLYIYEILNLPDYIPPKIGLQRLVFAWGAYRKTLTQIDKYMTAWLVDYCLLHRLPCPLSSLRPFLDAVMTCSDFREFYLGESSQLTEDGVNVLLAMTSDYHFRKSRYATGEHAAFFAKHMTLAMERVLRRLLSEGEADFGEDGLVEREWNAFTGSLCAHNIKCRIRVSYHSFSGSEKMRRIVTAAVKYAENRLRAFLSVKSRLSVPDFPLIYREVIDEYFRALFTEREMKRAEASRPAYEALYDAESRGFSLAGAEGIESSSWENVRRLVSDEELAECELSDIKSVRKQEMPFATEDADDSYGLLHADRVFLHSVLIGDTEEQEWVIRTSGKTADQFAERINEAFSKGFGDIVLEYFDDGYIVIEDYVEEVMKWIEKLPGGR